VHLNLITLEIGGTTTGFTIGTGTTAGAGGFTTGAGGATVGTGTAAGLGGVIDASTEAATLALTTSSDCFH